jgi:hypothetical protein
MNPIIETFYDKNGTKVHTKEFIYSQNIDDVLAVYITEEK